MIGVGRSDSFCWSTAIKTNRLIQFGHLQVNRYMQSCSDPTRPQDFSGNRSQGLNESCICAVRVGRRIDASRSVPKGRPWSLASLAHCATECIGLYAAKRRARLVEALEQIRQGIRERLGGIGPGVACGLRLRRDGSNYLANDFQASYTRIVRNFHGVFTRRLQLSLLGRRETPERR